MYHYYYFLIILFDTIIIIIATQVEDQQPITLVQLIDALAACILSSKIDPTQRQWAGIQLVKSIAALSVKSHKATIDLGTDLPTCKISKLEAHQNRLADCIWCEKKSLLATR